MTEAALFFAFLALPALLFAVMTQRENARLRELLRRQCSQTEFACRELERLGVRRDPETGRFVGRP